jgi:hypothetical protein
MLSLEDSHLQLREFAQNCLNHSSSKELVEHIQLIGPNSCDIGVDVEIVFRELMHQYIGQKLNFQVILLIPVLIYEIIGSITEYPS